MANLEQILKELIEADPTLAEHKEHLRTLLSELLKRKPDVEIDATFKAELREAVLAQSKAGGFQLGALWPKLIFAGLGAALVAAVFVVPMLIQSDSEMVAFDSFNVEKVGDEAFGELYSDASYTYSTDSSAAGLGGGGMLTVEESESDEKVESAIAPYPYEYSEPTYAYTGDEFFFEDSSVNVLKRVSSSSIQQASSLVSNLGFGLIDLNQFEDFKLTYLQLVPEDDKGYSAYVDFNNNEISISYYDPDMWLTYDWTPLTASDMLSDERLISLADDFLNDYGISTSGYGDPQIEDYDYYYYEDYYPEYVNVVYPLAIDGKEVYSEWGSQYGLTVSVDVKNERVYYVYGLKAQNFQSSSYSAASYDEVLAYALEGGLNGYWDFWGVDTEIQLGTPELGYAQIYQYDYSSSYELFVPAYIFPIVNSEETYRDYILVPLAADLMVDYGDYWVEPYLLEGEVAE